MSRQSSEDRPHVLIVRAVGDGLEPEVEWRVVHPPTCPWEAWRHHPGPDLFGEMHDPDRRFDFHRRCLTQYETDAVGMDDVEGWPLAPGRYRLVCASIYYPGEFGGTYGEEWGVEMRVEPITDASPDA